MMKRLLIAASALTGMAVPAFAQMPTHTVAAIPHKPPSTPSLFTPPIAHPSLRRSVRVGSTVQIGVTTMRAADFINTLGANLHVSQGTVNYNFPELDLAEMAYIGAGHARDNLNPWLGWLPTYEAIAAGGVKWDFIFATGGAQTPASMAAFFTGTPATATAAATDGLDTITEATPGSIDAVEGVNELNNFPITWNGAANSTATASLIQAALDVSVKADTHLPGASVFYFTGYCCGFQTGPNPATTPGLADFDTQHAYPGAGGFPWAWVNLTTAYPNETAPFGPTVETETGYQTPATTVRTKEDYTLDILADNAVQGVARTYLYELQDEGDGWGMFAAASAAQTSAAGTGTTANAALAVTLATPAATAMHNLVALLVDSDAAAKTFTPAPTVGLTVDSLPSGSHILLLVKASGEEDYVVWNESTVPVSGTLSFTAGVASANVFDPVTGTTATQKNASVAGVNLTLGDHPLVVEVTPNAAIGVVTPPAVIAPATGMSETGNAMAKSYANDAAAAAGGIAVGQFYRNGSAVEVRVQ